MAVRVSKNSVNFESKLFSTSGSIVFFELQDLIAFEQAFASLVITEKAN